MLTRDDGIDRASDLIARAMKAGANAADAVYGGHEALSVSVRLGALEDASRAEGQEIGLRIFVGTGSATSSTSDLSPSGLDTLVARTLAMAQAAPEDRYAGLAPDALIARGPFADYDSNDPVVVTPEALKMRALAAEAAALATPGVTNSQGGSASASRSLQALATSHGFVGGSVSSYHGVSASVLAGEGEAMERDYAHHGVRHLEDLDDAEAIGREAGRRAVARLGATKLKSGAMPVMFDPRVGPSLLGHLLGAISGAAIARKTSFLLDRLGTPVFAPGIRIIDDPWRPRGLRSRAFDGEGLATTPVTLIDDGVLTQWIAESASARQIGIAPTGHAVRGVSGAPSASVSNVHMAAGSVSRADLMSDIREGFYVTELIGMGVNGLTGDYSRGASGHRIVNGVLADAVSEVTIAGNLKDMFAALIPADDLDFRYAMNTPTLRIDGMTIAGG